MFPKLIRKNSAPSIRNRVLYKKGLDGDDSYLKLIIEFRKMYIFFAPKNKKKYPQKLPSKVAHNWLGLAVQLSNFQRSAVELPSDNTLIF